MKNLTKRGGKGMLPTCCLPLWGKEGVTFVFFLSQRKDEQNQVFCRAGNSGNHMKIFFNGGQATGN
jgi:hypothetical protein